MKRDPLRQLERLRQMREERAAVELARRTELLRLAQKTHTDATEAIAEQETRAQREERAMLAELAGQRITPGKLFAVHGKLDAFARERERLMGAADELETATEVCSEKRESARKTWVAQYRAVAKMELIVRAWSKKQQRREVVLSETVAEDIPPAASSQPTSEQVIDADR